MKLIHIMKNNAIPATDATGKNLDDDLFLLRIIPRDLRSYGVASCLFEAIANIRFR